MIGVTTQNRGHRLRICQAQRQLPKAYHNSTLSMHRGREATFAAISRDFYWRNLSKYTHNWVKRCPNCIKFKTSSPRPGPINVRLYLHPFHTLGIDLVGVLPVSVNGKKFILTAVCPFSNFLISIPIPDKTASTCVRALFDHVFLRYGFPSVLQSDRGGEFLNSILHRITLASKTCIYYTISTKTKWSYRESTSLAKFSHRNFLRKIAKSVGRLFTTGHVRT